MISREHRFHGLNALRHVYGRGQTVRGPLLTTKYLFNNNRSSYRAAVVVSRKVHKSAVVRNRIRRRIYEIIRRTEPNMTGPYDIVISIYSDAVASLEPTELEGIITGQLKKAGILGTGGPSRKSHAIVIPKERP